MVKNTEVEILLGLSSRLLTLINMFGRIGLRCCNNEEEQNWKLWADLAKARSLAEGARKGFMTYLARHG